MGVVAAEWSQDSCRERRERRDQLAAPGGEKHAPAHAPPRAPKITRAGWAPTPGSGHPSRGNGAPSSGARGASPGAQRSRAPCPGSECPPRARCKGKPRATRCALATRTRRLRSPGSQLANGRRAPALPRPSWVPLGPEAPTGSARRAGRSGSDSRPVAGVAQTHPSSSGARHCPLQAAGTLPVARTHREPPPAPAGGRRRRGGTRSWGRGHLAAKRPTGGSDGPWIPRAPLEPQQLPVTQAPRGAATRRPRGQELGLGTRGRCAPLQLQPHAPDS